MALTTTTFLFGVLACIQAADSTRVKMTQGIKSQKVVKAPEGKGTAQSAECQDKLLKVGVASGELLVLFSTSCGLVQADIEEQGEAFAVTLDGKSRLCHPTCQETDALGAPLPDIEAIRSECTDDKSVAELEQASSSFSLVNAISQGWHSCESNALRQDLDCDCDFKWNSFQRAYATMIGTGHTTPKERSAMYHRYKRECGCVEITSNSGGINLEDIAAGDGATNTAVSEELAQLRQFLLLEHVHQVVMRPDCEGAKKLFSRLDVTGTGEVDSDTVISTFAKYRMYQKKALDEEALEEVKEITDAIFSALERWSTGPKIPMSQHDIVSLVLGTGANC